MTIEDVVTYCTDYRLEYIENHGSMPTEIELTQEEHDLIGNPEYVLDMVVMIVESH